MVFLNAESNITCLFAFILNLNTMYDNFYHLIQKAVKTANNGFVNNILESLSMNPINVYSEPKYWPFIIVVLEVWKGLGYGSVVYMATITGIDTSIYEAAEIDGANIMQRIWYITVPTLRSTMITLVLLALGRVFRGSMDLFYNLVGNNGLLYNFTDVIDTFTFRTLLF